MATPQLDHDEISHLNEAVSHKGPIDDDETALRLLKANKEFNVYVAQKANYPLLIQWVRQLEDTTMRIYWLYIKMMKAMPYTWDHQRELVDALRQDKGEDVKKQTLTILTASEERVMKALFMHDQLYTQDLRLPASAKG